MSDIPCTPERLLAWLGQVDIYLFDQIMKGRVTPDMRVLDAGCGHGRNVRWLLRCGAPVWGVDRSAEAVARVRAMAEEVAPEPAPERFQVGEVSDLPFPDGHFDAVLSSAVLHFAEDEEAFEAMVVEMWRVLRVGGLLFARLASTIGVEGRVSRVQGRRFDLPDGTRRFLVDQAYLLGLTELLGGELLDPLKTTNVQNRRAMTTWVLRKTDAAPSSADGLGAARIPAPALGGLLERLEASLYRASPGSSGAPRGEPAAGVTWRAEEEAALEEAARGYGEEVRRLAGELGTVLGEARARLEEWVQESERGRSASPEGRKRAHGALERAKAALSSLKTRVLVEDALRENE